MNVLFVTGIFPPDSGGPASYVPEMAAALRELGHEVEVLTLSDSLEHEDALPYRVHRVRRGMFMPWRALKCAWKIARRARACDVVYVNGLGSEAALGSLLAGRPAVHKIVGDYAWERARGRGWFTGTLEEYQSARKPLRLRLLDLIRTVPIRLARQVIVPSEYLRGIVAGWGIDAEKILVVPNAVRADRTNAPTLPPWDGPTIMTVCRLVPWKGLDSLIRVIAEIPDSRLVVAGDGEMRDELEALAAATGANVLFLGRVPREHVRPLLRGADLFALNSTYEGLPHVVLEAMAAGVPVVATSAGGTPEVVEHDRTGLLVEPGNEPSLKSAIRRMLETPELAQRLSSKAADCLATRFSFEAMVSSTEKVLRSGLSVLSLGCTRGLWDGPGAEDYQRMTGYAGGIDRYIVVVNSYKKHALQPLRLPPNISAIPTNAFSPFDSFLRMLWISFRVLCRGRASLIQAQDPFYYGLAAMILGRLFRRPFVVCIYGPNVYDPHWLRAHRLHSPLGWIGRRVLRKASRIQVDGRLTQRSLIEAGHSPSQIALKPLVPANLEKFLEIQRDRRESGHVPRLLWVGRFAGQKNLPLLIKAAALLAARGRLFELQLVGNGPEEELLRALVIEAGLGERVRFHGVATREELPGIYEEADAFVLCSNYEGFARVLMEAAAAALPIVTTLVSGAEDAVLDGRSGFLVPVGDAGPLAEKIEVLLLDASLRARMGAAGRNYITTQVNPESNTPAQVAIWRDVVPSSAAPVAA